MDVTASARGSLYAEMGRRVPEVMIDRDAWVREMMRWHFSEETGARFWLRRRRALGFDPIADVNGLEDMRLFGLFDKSALRTVPVGDLVPRGFADRPRRVFETGGTSGPPCRVVDVTKGVYDVALYHAMLEARGLAAGNLLAMTPSGPHAYGTFVGRLADAWRGNVCAIDFDPRWVKRLLANGESSDPYIEHLLEQTRVLLHTQQPALLFTTSRLLMALVATLPEPLAAYGVRAVCSGGTSCSPEEERYLRENFLQDIVWIDTYGNTLMGHALQADAWAGAPHRAYYLPPPHAHIRVVDPRRWTEALPYGQRGQVLLITLHRDLFIPNLLERDSAVRVGPHPWFPFDGVAEVGPVHHENGHVEGVY